LYRKSESGARLGFTNIYRRGRHGLDFRDGALSSLALLPVRVDAETDRQAWSAALHLAERHGFTVYDAAYLKIASRRKIALATLDRELCTAASDEGVQLFGV
jgi:predicted nucleic acid-binding protein